MGKDNVVTQLLPCDPHMDSYDDDDNIVPYKNQMAHDLTNSLKNK